MYIKTLNKTSRKDISLAGGKGAALGELMAAGLPIPPGFVITINAYQNFNRKALPQEFIKEIYHAFDDLHAERVAVRSSAIVEDSSTASWAGQLESYLNVKKDNLLEAIQKCWNSIESVRATAYAKQQCIPSDQLAVAVVVQKMIDSEISGVMFTANPVTNNNDELVIEAAYGLGELLVQGEITPDSYILDKQTWQVKDENIRSQEEMLVYRDGGNKKVRVPRNNEFLLGARMAKELAALGTKIDNYFKSPQDIEWAYESDKFYIIQSRPITTLTPPRTSRKESIYEKLFSRDFSLPSVEAWVRGESTNPKGWTKKKQPFLPYIITERSDYTVHFYYDLQGVEWVTDLLSKLAHEDKKFLNIIEKTVLEKLSFIRPIYEKKKALDLLQLKRFLRELEDGYPWFEAMWWFCQMDEAKLVGLQLKGIQKVRALTDTLCNASDTVVRKSLADIYPQLGELSSVLTIEEITSEKIPDRDTLKKRYKKYFFGNNQLFVDKSYKDIEEVFGITFEIETVDKSKKQLNGEVAQKGKVKGFVRRVMGHQQIGSIKEGEILVASMTMPDFLPALQKAAAIVTDEGGMLSHAAIVARELGIPCIVGTKYATKLLNDGDFIEVDADKGIINILKKNYSIKVMQQSSAKMDFFDKKEKQLNMFSKADERMLKDLAALLNGLGLSEAVIVDQLAYKLNGIDVKMEQSWIYVVADSSKLPWIPKAPSIREVSLLNHPRYALCERFYNRYNLTLRLIPESSNIMKELSYKYKLSTGDTLNIAYPLKNVIGFTGLIDRYIDLEKQHKKSFSKQDISKWIRNTDKVRAAAIARKDEQLKNACLSCLEKLRILYQESTE